MLTADEITQLNARIDQAEREGKWLYPLHHNQPRLWFSPAELRAENAKGSFFWEASEWELRDPKRGLELLEQKAVEAWAEADQFRARLTGSRPEDQPPRAAVVGERLVLSLGFETVARTITEQPGVDFKVTDLAGFALDVLDRFKDEQTGSDAIRALLWSLSLSLQSAHVAPKAA